jgi:sugar phosphate isomerase/epimerase
MLDTFHMAAENEDAPASIERAMPYLRHIHFLDKERNPPSPADAHIDVPGILRALARARYRHYLSMPLVRGAGPEATEAIVQQLRLAIAALD